MFRLATFQGAIITAWHSTHTFGTSATHLIIKPERASAADVPADASFDTQPHVSGVRQSTLLPIAYVHHKQTQR